MKQCLLFPDPRPLVEKLGEDFFRRAPEKPGVYLMRDAADAVLYVGKALNLRRRLTSYRVANPDRMPRRHLRMVRLVTRIEFQECADESAALSRESELLLSLRPKFNRAGTWPVSQRFLAWRVGDGGLRMKVGDTREAEWRNVGPHGGSLFGLHAALARMIWSALQPERGLASLPQGWLKGQKRSATAILPGGVPGEQWSELEGLLDAMFAAQPEPLIAWVRERTAAQTHALDVAVREEDLETITSVSARFGKASVTDG